MFQKFLAITVAMFLASPAFAATYEIDPVHSTIGFAVKHMVVSTTRGQFNASSGTIEYDPADFAAFKADVKIDAASIDTNNEKRDMHLKSKDFFEVETYQAITFNNAALIKTEIGGLAIVGDLTIKGVTRKITVLVEISGPIANPHGGNVLGISGETVINRQDFGVTFNAVMEAGGLMVDNDVKLVIDLELHSK